MSDTIKVEMDMPVPPEVVTVRDRAGFLPDKEFESREQAERWVSFCFEWHPSARLFIVPKAALIRAESEATHE